uniref:HV1PST n=1 Tax=Hordeum vulgare TaxID=4513 RepID=Q9SWT7_HORVU|nr:HV1PST [Hordeum vulgare]
MVHAGGSSSGVGSAPESNWPNSLDQPATEELYRLGLLVPPGCRLVKPWRISKDGYPTKGDPATVEEFAPTAAVGITSAAVTPSGTARATTPSSRSSARGGGRLSPSPRRRPCRFPRSSTYRRSRSSSTRTATRRHVGAARRPARLSGDGGGRRGSEAAREEAEIAVAIQAAQALGAADPQPVAGDDDDDDDWDGLAVSSDNDDDSD